MCCFHGDSALVIGKITAEVYIILMPPFPHYCQRIRGRQAARPLDLITGSHTSVATGKIGNWVADLHRTEKSTKRGGETRLGGADRAYIQTAAAGVVPYMLTSLPERNI